MQNTDAGLLCSGTQTAISATLLGVSACVNSLSNVIVMYYAGPRFSEIERLVLENAVMNGVLPIAPAGSAGTDALLYPAAYPSVLSVGAVDEAKVVTYWSQKNSQVCRFIRSVYQMSICQSVIARHTCPCNIVCIEWWAEMFACVFLKSALTALTQWYRSCWQICAFLQVDLVAPAVKILSTAQVPRGSKCTVRVGTQSIPCSGEVLHLSKWSDASCWPILPRWVSVPQMLSAATCRQIWYWWGTKQKTNKCKQIPEDV